MAHLEAFKHISPDSGCHTVMHPCFNPKIKDYKPPDPPLTAVPPPRDRAGFADPEKKSLLAAAKKSDLTESIESILEGVQLSQLTSAQLKELALLVSERGVVFFRDTRISRQNSKRSCLDTNVNLNPA